ncbi:MAG: lysophospholipid acyltransferase family protein [Planctomycetota bacterium]|jgi:1-acyl-sn-glycerol-3-phosphate acyltransferase
MTTDNLPLAHPTRRNIVWLTIQFIVRLVFALWLRYRARDCDNLPQDGGGLVLVNHQSFLDPMLVGLPLKRPVSYLARDNLFRVPVIGWILRRTYVMPINRDAASTASIRSALQRMEHGFLVGLFPEGTRSDDGDVGEFKPGFISLIRRTKVPVYPVGIAGAHEAMPRGGVRLFPGPVRVVFGKPLCEERLAELRVKGREEELIQYARDAVVACQTEAARWRAGQDAAD